MWWDWVSWTFLCIYPYCTVDGFTRLRSYKMAGILWWRWMENWSRERSGLLFCPERGMWELKLCKYWHVWIARTLVTVAWDYFPLVFIYRTLENNYWLAGVHQRCVTYAKQCWGPVTFWFWSGCGSGSSDPYLWLKNPDADQGGPQNYESGSGCGFVTLVHLLHSSKIKSHEEVTNSRNQVFLIIFAGRWKDSDPDTDADPGGPKHTDPTVPDPQHCAKPFISVADAAPGSWIRCFFDCWIRIQDPR